MEKTKVLILLCSIFYTYASHHPHTIPVEGYATELQDLGQHVEIPETPVKIIKITKTVAVKVPVPYPVKVIEKVPYPVHISKPYPVPVPQIVKIPVPVKHDHGTDRHGVAPLDSGHQYLGGNGNSQYQVQESPSHDSPGPDHFEQGYSSDGFGNDHSSNGHDDSYGPPPNSYNGYSDDNDNSNLESQNYDQAVQSYLHKNGRNIGEHSHFGLH